MRTVLLFLLAWFALPRPAAAGDGQVTIKAGSAEVYSQMSRTSPVVKTLKRGDAVAIELSLAGADETWCSIAESGAGRTLGYVPCSQLEIPQPASAGWEKAQEPTGPALARPPVKPADPLAGIFELCPALKNPTPKRFADFLQGAACASMLQGGRPTLYTPAQLSRMQAIADRTGAQACYEHLIAAYKANGAIDANGRVADRTRLSATAQRLFQDHPECTARVTAFGREVLSVTDPKAAAQLKELEDKMKRVEQPTLP
jgi:hypothetical protein